MNIIIPLGGRGERFLNAGYSEPKPFIKIFDKMMIQYVLDNIATTNEDFNFVILNKNLLKDESLQILKQLYPKIIFIELIKDTAGAAETLMIGLEHIIGSHKYNEKSLIIDCDTFYTTDIVSIFRECNNNMVFYTKNYDVKPIYSYITCNEDAYIIKIQEKVKISDNANTGAYAFSDIKTLLQYCKYIVENNITFNNEPYTSCVIYEMIKNDIKFIAKELDSNTVFSLGTPTELEKYKSSTFAFLFDLDGTLVKTDEIYFTVWYNILKEFNIALTYDIFKKYIQGNNDKYVLNTLLPGIDINLDDLSSRKDQYFIHNIDKLIVIEDCDKIMKNLKKLGHKCCIVTNCNRLVAEKIVKHINIEYYIDFIISANDCKIGKPNSEPYNIATNRYNISNTKCLVFEDSKTGILSGKGIQPKCLIGVETIYTQEQLLNYGANITIDNYKNLDIETLLEHKNDMHMVIDFKKSIVDNIHFPMSEIIVDENKLKGGYIADVIAFSIKTYDDISNNYILKYENTCKTSLSTMANKLQLYEREYYFYEAISRYINIKIPKFITLVKNESKKNVGLILENLSIGDRFKLNLNLNEEKIDLSMKIIETMAKMHSQFWNKNLSICFPELKKNNDETFCPFLKEFIDEKYPLFKDKWKKILKPESLYKCDDIFNNFELIQQRLSKNNLTFIHGDIKSPNIFYDTHNNNEPYLLDWQHCANGKGSQDLIFFIIESFEISNIKLLFPIFKNYYFKKLLEYKVTNYSYEDFEKDLIDALCYVPFFTAVWFGSTPNDELIDKNWPYFFIQKFIYLLEIMNI